MIRYVSIESHGTFKTTQFMQKNDSLRILRAMPIVLTKRAILVSRQPITGSSCVIMEFHDSPCEGTMLAEKKRGSMPWRKLNLVCVYRAA